MTLRKAILSGDLEEVRRLIAEGADVQTRLSGGETPIQLAARQSHVDIVRALAHAGADPRDLSALELPCRLVLFLKTAKEPHSEAEDLLDVAELIEWLMEMTDEFDRAVEADLARGESPLFKAVLLGRPDDVRKRIAAGDDLDEVREIHRDTPLLAAIKRGHEEIFRDLVAGGADVEVADSWGRPLRHTIRNLRFTKLLVDAGADVNHVCGKHIFLEAVIKESLENTVAFPQDPALVVRLLLEAGADPLLADNPCFLLHEIGCANAWDVFHEILLHCPEKAVAEAERFLQPREDDPETSALFASIRFRQAALFGELEKLKGLLASGEADVNDQEMGGTALMQAASCGRLEVMRFLIGAGADVHAVDPSPMTWNGSTALARAAEPFEAHKVRSTIRFLLDAGADVNQAGARGRTALMHAVATAHRRKAAFEAVPLLLEAGADPLLEDELGYTAWMLAESLAAKERERARAPDRPERDCIYWDDAELAETLERCRRISALLVAAGAEPRGLDELRFLGAVEYRNARRVKRLLAAGVDPNLRTPDGDPAIVTAAENGDDACVALLIDAGCEVDAVGWGCPWTALERALRRGRPASVARLLAAGADPRRLASLDPDDPYAALTVAEKAGHIEAARRVRRALPAAALARRPVPEPTAAEKAQERIDSLAREAAWGNLTGVHERLAEPEVDLDGLDVYGRTALTAAAEAGQLPVMEALIEAGAGVDRVIRRATGGAENPRSTPLTAAAIGPSAHRGQALRLLLEAGADVDLPGADGRTALSHAVERDVGFFGRTGEPGLSTRTLIEAGADLEARDRFGLSAWTRAMSLAASIDVPEVSEQYREIAGLLAAAGASPGGALDVELIAEAAGPPTVAMATYRRAAAEDVERVRRLLERGASPDARRHDGTPALVLAVRAGRRRVASLLIDAGCGIDARARGERGATALIEAAWNGDYDLVCLLLEAGADKSLARDPAEPSTTAGSLASSRHFDRIARLLGEPKPGRGVRRPWDLFGLLLS